MDIVTSFMSLSPRGNIFTNLCGYFVIFVVAPYPRIMWQHVQIIQTFCHILMWPHVIKMMWLCHNII